MRRGDHMANLEGISVDILGPENLKIDNVSPEMIVCGCVPNTDLCFSSKMLDSIPRCLRTSSSRTT